MKKLLIATQNPGKFGEIGEALKGVNFELVFLGDIEGDFSDFAEDGKTFEDNARKKAEYFHEKLGMLTLGEDSGIKVDAMEGELGVQTRRWGAGEEASDEEWLDYFMERMKIEDDRSARFICCAYLKGADIAQSFEGETYGQVAREVLAPILPGLPLSSVFVPDGCDTCYAGLGREWKNKISHRGKALGKLREFLEKS